MPHFCVFLLDYTELVYLFLYLSLSLCYIKSHLYSTVSSLFPFFPLIGFKSTVVRSCSKINWFNMLSRFMAVDLIFIENAVFWLFFQLL